jgi:hypothetical protein
MIRELLDRAWYVLRERFFPRPAPSAPPDFEIDDETGVWPPVQLSARAQEMVAQGVAQDAPEPEVTPAPLAGSLADRYARARR